jgi:hypothetical protein
LLTNVSEELLVDILRAWETWPGTSKEFYQSLGTSKTQMAVLMGKAKKARREGHYPAEEFKEIQVAGAGSGLYGMEVLWEGGRVIRFSKVVDLVEFLRGAKS